MRENPPPPTPVAAYDTTTYVGPLMATLGRKWGSNMLSDVILPSIAARSTGARMTGVKKRGRRDLPAKPHRRTLAEGVKGVNTVGIVQVAAGGDGVGGCETGRGV